MTLAVKVALNFNTANQPDGYNLLTLYQTTKF